MSRLFQILPAELFHPFAAPGAAIYAAILLKLFDETQRHHQALSRDSAIHHITTLISNPEALNLTQDAQDDMSDEGSETQARASAILRYLTRRGWLRSETQSDFTQTYILPDYAFRLLRTFDEIAANQALPLQGLICAIHDLLQAARRDGNVDIRLPEAYRQTNHLVNGLKELQHNIGIHIERVLRQLQARDVLDQIFSSYHAEIIDRVYHHLQTTDHVSRYRPGIIEATTQLERSGQIENAARRLYERGEAPSIALGANRLVEQARVIREQFQELDNLLSAIQTRHSQFVDSAVRTVELQLASHTTTSGQLHAILTALLKGRELRDDEIAPLVNLFNLGFVEPESLAAPGRAPVPFVPEATALPFLSAEELETTQEETLRALNRAVSRERVRRYVRLLLADRDEITSDEIPIAGADDVPLLIYLKEYGNGALGYRVEMDSDAGWVERNGIGFRRFVLRKHELDADERG
ncbi:MAG: hypothetical protein HY782_03270 [Chloroflexi bacterium]|nr:hypothetical protein [Chloroflexota bacterium]